MWGEGTLYVRVKKEHDLVGIELLPIPFEEFYQFFNQLALDKATVARLLAPRWLAQVEG